MVWHWTAKALQQPSLHFTHNLTPSPSPRNSQGVKVGEWWKDRLDCRQWGAHFPHVAGIAGQSSQGAQSVVLSGGYLDDRCGAVWHSRRSGPQQRVHQAQQQAQQRGGWEVLVRVGLATDSESARAAAAL